VRDALVIWIGAWLVGQVLAAAVAAASGHTNVVDAGPVWFFGIAVAGWVPLVAGVWGAGRRFGTGNLASDFGYSFRPIDLIGLPLGVLTQLVLVPLLYWPLRTAWPSTFTRTHLEQRARDLWDHASGGGLVLLVLVVAVGAPLVEELVYRGLLQGAFTRRLDDVLGVVLVAAIFAIVHFQPVETPGLFVVGLVLGTCALRTRRLGMGVLAHMAFNATGLVLVAVK
jgi:hypothetical protein